MSYGVVVSMYVFPLGDVGSNPGLAGAMKFHIDNLYIKVTLGNNRLFLSPRCT